MNKEQDHLQRKTAVVLDTRVLAKRCLDLEREIQDWRQRFDSLELNLKNVQEDHQTQERLIDFARLELQCMKQRIHTNIKAVEHHTGKQERFDFLKNKIEDSLTLPKEINEIDRMLHEEVQHMYPSKPQSKVVSASRKSVFNSSGIPAFRFAASSQ